MNAELKVVSQDTKIVLTALLAASNYPIRTPDLVSPNTSG
jgi:hypothetical protein